MLKASLIYRFLANFSFDVIFSVSSKILSSSFNVNVFKADLFFQGFILKVYTPNLFFNNK